MNVAEFSVRQTVLVNVLFFVCLFGGIAAFSRVPIEYFPEINLNQVVVTTLWTGSSAEEVERLVTTKLEEEIGSGSDIREMRSDSQANISTISVDFDEDLDEIGYQAALNDVRAAIDRVQDLPAGAEEPFITEIITSEIFPVVTLALVDTGGVGETVLREIARDVRERVDKLPGANRAEVRGERERELRVLVDRDAAARFGLAVPDVAQRIRRHNLNLPAGSLTDGARESIVRAQGDYQNVDQILETVVSEGADGSVVRLSDIAQVEEGLERRIFANRYNGEPALMVSLTKKAGADVLDLSAVVDTWIESYRPVLPEGVELHKTMDTADFVAPRMRTLVDNLMAGIALVVTILWFTIGFRNALLTSVAIPFSFLTAMILFPLWGVSINATTLMGMLLVSGMLVDDAIIVLENVYRRVESGEDVRTAVVDGTTEVMWPVTVAVCTTVAAFAPLLMVSGIAGKFIEILPKAVVLCLVASLFECLLILPAHYLHLGSRKRAAGDASTERQAQQGRRSLVALLGSGRARVTAGLEWLRDRYEAALGVVLDHRASFSALMASCFVLSVAGWQWAEFDLFPGEFDTFNVMLETPSDYSLDQTDAVARRLEGEVSSFVGSEIRNFSTTVGMSVDSNYDRLTGTNYAMIFLDMSGSERAKTEPEAVLLAVRERLESHRAANPEGIVDLRVDAEQDGPPIGKPVEVRIQGDDWATGLAIASEMMGYLRRQEGVYNVDHNLKPGPPEMRLLVDEERAARHGLGFESIAAALRAANDGEIASSFRDPSRGEDLDIRVQLAPEQRRNLQDLLDVELRAAGGYLVKLRDVADVELTRGYRSFRRYDERRTVTVFADLDKRYETSLGINRKLQAEFADIELRFPEVGIEYAGEYKDTQEGFGNLFAVFPIALLAIYMLLAALFRSYLQPLVVSVAIPFAFMGVVLGVIVLGYQISFILLYAVIGLTGVVVNDSLVMVDFINRARAQGMPLLEAVRRSGAMRFRPILLTTLTTVSALLPMAFGLQGSSKTYGPFAAAISFGLVVAMAGTLFAVPVAYTNLIRTQERLQAWWRRRASRGAPAPAAGGGS